VRENSVAVRASRVRARLLFVLLDTICVFAGYGLPKSLLSQQKRPQLLQHFALFLVVAVIVALVANQLFGCTSGCGVTPGPKRLDSFFSPRW